MTHDTNRPPGGRWALTSLVLGAVGIGIAPLFVRLSEVGPSATGFFRMLLAIPLFGLLLELEHRRGGGPTIPSRRARGLLVAAGLFFALDIALWHYSIVLGTVANATLLTNTAPVWVALAAWGLFGERPTPLFVVALVLAMSGAALLVGDSFRVSRTTAFGDLLGLTSGLFYAGYQLSIKRVRAGRSTLAVMTASTTITAVGLLVFAIVGGETLGPQTGRGWLYLVALAVISQVAGQGLIAYGLAHLASGFAAVTLLVQPMVAALVAWLLLSEPLGPTQAIGGAVVLGGIVLARIATAQQRDRARLSTTG